MPGDALDDVLTKGSNCGISHTHRIHGAGIYANIGGILMGSMLPYIAYMDPMGYKMAVSTCLDILWVVIEEGIVIQCCKGLRKLGVHLFVCICLCDLVFLQIEQRHYMLRLDLLLKIFQ